MIDLNAFTGMEFHQLRRNDVPLKLHTRIYSDASVYEDSDVPGVIVVEIDRADDMLRLELNVSLLLGVVDGEPVMIAPGVTVSDHVWSGGTFGGHQRVAFNVWAMMIMEEMPDHKAADYIAIGRTEEDDDLGQLLLIINNHESDPVVITPPLEFILYLSQLEDELGQAA